MITRRDFLRRAGLTAAAAAIINPFDHFARTMQRKVAGSNNNISGSKKMVLTYFPFEAQLRHVFTIAGSSRTTTPIVLTEITYEGFTGYDVTATFEGNFSADQSSISGTLTGSGTVMGISLQVSGTWQVSK